MDDEIPADVLRRRELFAEIRCEIVRLKPDETRISIDLTEADMLASLASIESILEYAGVARSAKAYCDQLVREAGEVDLDARGLD